MATITLRFYAELNDFLSLERRQRDWVRPFQPPAPARHVIETCGVPHTEVELILRDGESIGLDASVGEGDRLAVYPMFESFDVRSLLRLRTRPLRRPRFVADAHLGALARRLRLLGFDTLWHNDWGDRALARLAAEEQRILLTRDRQLLMRQAVTHGCYLRSGSTAGQLAELIQRLQLCAEIAPFTRCMVCNGLLESLAPDVPPREVPPRVRERHRDFWRCGGCHRLYWMGSHWEALRRQVATLCPTEPRPGEGAQSSLASRLATAS
jgi:uncharacterized protein with PIN domain